MITDEELLRRFAHERDESAFTAVVRRRIDFVFAVASRQLGGDAQLAEDATQEVFRDLAAKAAAVSAGPSLASWLYTATRFAAIDVHRRQARWLKREQAAIAQHLVLSSGTDPEWEKLRPVLDEAIHELGERDRAAIVLRYFENQPLAEVGSRLGVTENTARMRVDRALDKLRARLARHGIVSTAAALTTALAAQPVVTAPPALAATLAANALAAAGSAAPLVALTFVHTTKVVFGLASAAGLVGVGIYLSAERLPVAPPARMAVVATAPAPTSAPAVPATTQLRREVATAVSRPLTATAGAPEIQIESEQATVPPANPVITPAASGSARNYRVDDLTPIINRALRGGRDFARGKQLFESTGCAVCHAFAGEPGGIGPDLTGVGGRFGAYEILQSILEPSAVISDLYGTKDLRTTDGRAFSGKLAAQNEESIELIPNFTLDPATGKATWANTPPVVVPLAEIASLSESPTSLMPTGLINGLNEDEVADLVAYLMSGGTPTNRMFQPLAATPGAAK
jgi:RNA polymerase sigma factor (sigma-70 family)